MKKRFTRVPEKPVHRITSVVVKRDLDPEVDEKEEKTVETTDTAEDSDGDQETESAEIQPSVPREPVAADEPVKRTYENSTAYELYLREIGKTKLLTPQEEVVLARKIKRGDKKAREEMIKANLRLVVKIAREYEGYGLPLLDLINEGNIGLMKGVERFDPTKGAKLSTYSAWWIKQAIKRALANQGKTIRLPVHVVDKLFHMRKAAIRLQELLGREPSDEELADELDMTVTKVKRFRTASLAPSSLDAPLGDEDSNKISDVVADSKAHTPYEELEEKTNTNLVREVVATLDPREQTILRFRFGLDGEGEKTLEEVGEKFGVTRERIRQIQNIALTKLRKKIEKLDMVKLAA
jgi:RNA polymerase primary sigma factor